MFNKKIILILTIFIVLLLAVSAVNATDNVTNDVVSVEETTDTISVDESNEVVSVEDNLQTTEENVILTQTNDDKSVGVKNDLDVLSTDYSTYSELAREIGSGGYITLQHDYYTYDTGNTIEITVDGSVIDGNGALIDMETSNIQAFYVKAFDVTIKNLIIKNVNFNGGYGGAVYFDYDNGVVENCNFVNNSASWGGAVYFSDEGTVTNCNFNNNSAGSSGGAVYFYWTGTVTNCTFTDNTASEWGGAVYFLDEGTLTNCNFEDNSANGGGAIYSFNWYTTADTCIFKTNSGENFNTVIFSPTLNVNNFTTYYGSGEKLTFDLKTNSNIPVTNGNISIRVYFKNNDSWVGDYNCLSGEGWIPDLPGGSYYAIFNTEYAEFKPINRTITVIPTDIFYALNYTINGNDDSVINLNNDFYFNSEFDSEFVNGIVINRPVTINGNGHTINALQKARIFQINAENVVLNNITFTNATSGDGGAIYFSSSGTVEYCNFTNNSASWGGAVYFSDEGTVTNCNFTDNSAGYGGAFCFYQGTVINCNFTDNHATYDGGAIQANSGSFENCDFADNSASLGGGGAVYIFSGTFKNCDFADNSASLGGGAVYMYLGTVENCNFTGNNATTGSAIHFEDYWSQDTISNSIFLNNRANAEDLQVTKNENNITITFTGHNNLLNAIYSNGDVDFTNVTYWGANGINNTGSSTITPLRSNKEAGQNITVIVLVNDNIVLDEVKVTDADGTIVLDINVDGNYTIVARHDTDLYYTEAERTISNMTFNVNVTSKITNNLTVNITAESNIPQDIFGGKLLFILQNGTEIGANYSADGIWWAVHTFDDYGVYNVKASYDVLNNVTVNKGTIVTAPLHTFLFLNYTINGNDNSVIELSNDFYFDPAYDAAFRNGIMINRPVTIKGNGSAIDAKGQARIFNVQSEGAVIENLTLKNANSNGDGGAIYFSSSGTVINCNFINNSADYGGAIVMSCGSVTNCTFTNNTAFDGAVYFGEGGTVINCNFVNNKATSDESCGGAIYFSSSGTVENCNFVNNSACNGGAIYFDYNVNGNIINCNFVDNSASNDGGAILFGGSGTVENCNFTNNVAFGDGGAILFAGNCNVVNCNFTNNTAFGDGGAICVYDEFNIGSTVTNCKFTGNNATSGSAIHFWDNTATETVSNSIFLSNRADSEDIKITPTENNITITFTGKDNLLNAIYSECDVSFTNVTYWGANGIANTGSSPTILPRSNKEAGQNISVIMVVNDILTLNETKVTNDEGTIILDLVAGNYTVTARHDADSYYTEYERTETFNIHGNETSLELSALENTVTATISPDDAVGNITFTVTNESGIVKTIETALSNGTADLDLSELLNGEYNITATYEGSINYYPAKASMAYQKVNIDVFIDVSAADITYGEDMIVEITGSVDGDYTVTVNGVTKDAVIVVGEASSVNFGVLNAGTYEVVASYVGDGDYNESSVETTVKVNRATPTISVFADNIKYGEDLVVNVQLPSDVSRRVTVTVGDETKMVSLKNGSGSAKFSGLAKGTYTVTATYGGDSNYLKSSASAKVKVTNPRADIQLSVEDTPFGDDLVVNVQLPSDVMYRVNVSVGGMSKLVSLKNGVGSAKFSGLVKGTYTVTATYGGDSNYLKSSASAKVKVTNPPADIQLTVKDTSYGEDLVVNVKLPSDVSRRVTVTVGDETKMVSLKNGMGSVKFSGLAMGTYTVTATYGGDANYVKSSASAAVKVTKPAANIQITANDISYGEDLVVNLQLPSDVSRRVSVTIGNETKLVSLKNGAGSVKFSNLAVGTYTISASYGGDSIYLKSSVNTTVKVTKATPEIQVTADNITYGEALTVNVQLPSDVIKRAEVTIDGESKLVNLRNGSGSIKFTGLDVGTHDVVVSYAGDTNYKRASTTTTIEVKE